LPDKKDNCEVRCLWLDATSSLRLPVLHFQASKFEHVIGVSTLSDVGCDNTWRDLKMPLVYSSSKRTTRWFGQSNHSPYFSLKQGAQMAQRLAEDNLFNKFLRPSAPLRPLRLN
jgi:hypothetical protein